jgi:hypothetical protein
MLTTKENSDKLSYKIRNFLSKQLTNVFKKKKIPFKCVGAHKDSPRPMSPCKVLHLLTTQSSKN